MTQPTHDDPFAEVRAQAVQALAVAATVGEAAARWYAVGVQDRAQRAERDNAARTAQAAADRAANAAQEREDRRLINRGLTNWINRASMAETLRVWRTATIHAAAGDARAAQAATRAQQRLRTINQPFADAYDRRRGSGMAPAEAMRAAAYDLWQSMNDYIQDTNTPRARPHEGRRDPAQLLPGGANLDDLDAAVRDEVVRLAAHISPEALDKLQKEWRATGRVPAADAADLLRQYANDAAHHETMTRAVADELIALADAARPNAEPADPPAVDASSHETTNVEPDHAATLAGQRQSDDADTETRAAELDGGTADVADTPRVDEHHDGQNRAAIHLDHADADRVAAARQQELMRHAFPPLTSVDPHTAHPAGHQPATTSPTQRTRRTR